MSLSVVVLTRNAERHLAAALASVSFADEILVLDEASEDRTVAIAREHGARILTQDRELVARHLGNFDVARNAGFDAARSAWILVLDADEAVPAALAQEILAVTGAPAEVAYGIPRTNLFWGRPLRVLGADVQLRLFPRGLGRYEGDELDARLVVDCRVDTLTTPLVHRQAESLRELLRKLDDRTAQRARVHARRGEAPASLRAIASLFVHTFLYHLRVLESWRDGAAGIAIAALYALYPTVTALRLRRLRSRGAAAPT